MRMSVLSATLAACVLPSVLAGYAPASAQDFSITNTVEPGNPNRRNVMRQLQAWWDVHAYYPKHASNNDESGIVKVHLLIHPDGEIWMVRVVESSGSRSLDGAAPSAFSGGFVTPFPEGEPDANIDLSLHYVLAHRHDEPVTTVSTQKSSTRSFSIANDPVKSPILDTMLQRTCTGKVVRQGIRNHPAYGVTSWAQAVFFRRPDGSPWVKFYESGYPSLSPVIEVGKVVQWTGREERIGGGKSRYAAYTVWPDGENNLSGNIDVSSVEGDFEINHGGTVDLTCATEVVPAIGWSAWFVTPGHTPRGDPP